MSEINVLKLDNGKKYYEIDTLVHNDIKYLLLADCDNIKKVSIRKIIIENGKEYIDFLDSDYEFNTLFKLFHEKNKAFFD